MIQRQPPSGGCVLKLFLRVLLFGLGTQPPSGGCVLKLSGKIRNLSERKPAAFRRLCVETLALK